MKIHSSISNYHSVSSSPTTQNKQSEQSNDKVKDNNNNKASHQLSQKDRERLNDTDEQTKVKSKKDSLPQHIQKMIEQIQELKEQIKVETERLIEIKARADLEKEMQQEMELQQSNYIAQLQLNLVSLVDNVKNALKDAGITDPGVLISAMA